MILAETGAAVDPGRFTWAERLSPRMLKSPWWIGHIPFAYELIGRLRPRTIVELGTYSGSSFAAFCQAVEACGLDSSATGSTCGRATSTWGGSTRTCSGRSPRT